jgi:uncharacterized membrane protein YfcA
MAHLDAMAVLPFDPPLALALVAIAFLSGVGITTIGPGGIFVTIALYLVTPLSAGEIAGSAHATFVATGLVGTATYRRSGELRGGEGRVLAAVLGATSVVGALAGAALNAVVPRSTFGLLLGGLATAVGVVILYRQRRGFDPSERISATTRRGKVVFGVLGAALGLCSGVVGVGGPVVAVPALVFAGVPMLLAVAVAQVQSVFIAVFATTGYLLQGTVVWPVVVLAGAPLLGGVVVGWRVAHLVPPAKLKACLGVVLLAVGPYLAFA